MALKSKKKLGFIDGTLIHPPLNPIVLLGHEINVISWSWHELQIVESILWMESTQEIGQDLKDQYHQRDIICISNLQEEIYSVT